MSDEEDNRQSGVKGESEACRGEFNPKKFLTPGKELDKKVDKYEGEMGVKHTVMKEEQAAFADWINNNLLSDAECRKLNVRKIICLYDLVMILRPIFLLYRTLVQTCTRN